MTPARRIAGLVADGTDVRGLRLEDGTTVEADLVVIGGGRNSPVLEWIAELGGPVQPIEQESEAGIIYISRFHRLREGRELPLLTKEGAGGDLSAIWPSPASTATTGRSPSPSGCRPATVT